MVEHLCWSLVGDVEVDPLESADDPSIMLVKFLYGAFLVMGAILLINMMIALLSNTYQEVQDHSLMEWSFKKAITIQTYSSCDPIPVPFNLVSLVFKCCGWQKCFSWCRNRKQTAGNKNLKRVLKRLESEYFAEYGYFFPLTDERKLDRVLLETERNRQMADQIAQTTFTAYHSLDKNVLPTGPQMRASGEIPDEQQSFRTITRESGSRGSDLEPAITMALDHLKDINKSVDADCETFKKEVQEIRNHLNNARKESQALESKLSHSFKRVKKMFFFDERRREEELFDPFTIPAESKIADTVSQLDQTLIETWVSEAEEKERKVPAVVDRLGMIRPELENLGKKTKEKTDEMLEELAQLKSEAQFQHLSLKSMNKGLDKNFLEIEELIQGCCTIKKIPLSTLEGSRDCWQESVSD